MSVPDDLSSLDHQSHQRKATLARARLHDITAVCIGWLTFTIVMVALPCIVWLWRWAL